MWCKNEKRILFFYIACFLAAASTMALFQPLWNGAPTFLNPPDEHGRILIPWYICQHGILPTGLEEETRVSGYGISYGLYTILPYVIQGYVMRFVSIFTNSVTALLYAARFVNVLSGTIMAYVVYLMSGKLFQDQWIKWLFCFGVMYLPQGMFLHTYVNTESMCLLSTAIIIYALVSAYQEGFTRKNCVILSVGIILCALSYYNAYGFILSSIFLFLAYFCKITTVKTGHTPKKWMIQCDWKQMLIKGAFIGTIVLLGIGWLFIRNYILYDGDFLGLATQEKLSIQYADPSVNPLTRPTPRNRGESILAMIFNFKFLRDTYVSFVANFGSFNIVGNILMYGVFFLIFCVGVAAVLFLRHPKEDFISGQPMWKRTFFHASLLFCILMPVILWLYYCYAMDYQPQGRYLLPAVIPLMYYVARGYQKLTSLSKMSGWLRKGIIGVVVLCFFASTLYMTYCVSLPRYLKADLAVEGVLK